MLALMQAQPARSALAALLARHRDIEARMGHGTSPSDVLANGEAILSLAEQEEEALAALFDFVDPSVRAELAAEHREFAEDLGLLDWLVRTTPDSPDIASLAASLGRRMRQHLERDGRLLQRALTLTS